MLLYRVILYLTVIQSKDINCSVLVRPQDVTTYFGCSAVFRCATNSSIKQTGRIKWLYSEGRALQRFRHVWAHGRVFPQWRDRLKVTQETASTGNAVSTLTVDPVTTDVVGFYTCVDDDDEKTATAELALVSTTAAALENGCLSSVANVIATTTSYTAGPRNAIHSGYEEGSGRRNGSKNDSTMALGLSEKHVSADDNDVIALVVIAIGGGVVVTVVPFAVLVGVCIWRRRQRKRTEDETRTSPLYTYVQEETEDRVEYEEIPAADEYQWWTQRNIPSIIIAQKTMDKGREDLVPVTEVYVKLDRPRQQPITVYQSLEFLNENEQTSQSNVDDYLEILNTDRET